MTDLVVESIVSSREFGTIFAGRLDDGSVVRVKAAHATMFGRPTIGELWSVDGDLQDTRWGPQIAATRAVRAMPSGKLMIDYLSGCVAGIGPARAERLWKRFENRLPEALDIGDVEALAAVMDPDRPVLGPRLAAALVAAWQAMASEARLVEWLAAIGVTDLRIAQRVAVSFTIDVHHHILPDIFWRATNDAHSPVGGILPAPWSKESTLSYMDDAGIDVAITSISTPGVHMGDDAAARDLARGVNELSAKLI